MKEIITAIRTHWYPITIIGILLFATFLRFYNYENRWGLAYDQAHDAVLARYAVQEGKLPLLGPFSSAGPFQTGGEWYWILMFPTMLYPYSVLSPWIFITGLYVFFVFVIIIVGKKLESREFGLMVGLMAAISTAQIAQSVNLTNQAPHALNGLLAILAMIYYVKTKKIQYLFALCFLISFSASIHLQGVGLFMLFISTIIFSGMPALKYIPLLLIGFLLPLAPIIIYDINHDFFNLKNMYYYYLYDQYKISLDVLGRRWLTYAGVFIPKAWSHVIGGFPFFGYVTLVGIFLSAVYVVLRGKLKREWVIIFVSLMLMISLLRYTRTPLFDSYLVFMHPFILLLTGYVIYLVYLYKKYIGLGIFLILVLFTLYRDIPEVKGAGNLTASFSTTHRNFLVNKYPGEKFAIYDRYYNTRDKSVPLVLFLDVKGEISNTGRKIGVSMIPRNEKDLPYPVIFGEKGGIQLFDLQSSSSAQLEEDMWVLTNPREVYTSTEEWYTE